MIKNLSKHGNSLALVIDKAVLNLLKIKADTPLDISTDGEVLLVSPIRQKSRQHKFRQSLKVANHKYARALKHLAD